MYQSPEVKTHLEQSSTTKSKALILAEWNLNVADNISKIGNYRYRPATTTEFPAKAIAATYDYADAANDYTGATDSDVVLDGGYNQDDEPIAFASTDKKLGMLFSLEQCFDKFRPRSGINKMIFDETLFINDASTAFANRPRYYIASRDDVFKYWTSIRKESSNLTGVSYPITTEEDGLRYYINDAAPFVVYKNHVPTNKIVVKLQTNVGTEEVEAYGMSDPFFGSANMTVPKMWKVEYLDDNDAWQEVWESDPATQVFGPSGYAELQYGLIVPNEYTRFVKAPDINSLSFLPDTAPDGYAYLLIENTGDKGTYFVANSSNTAGDEHNGVAYPGWDIWEPQYGWYFGEEVADIYTPFVSDLVNPPSYVEGGKTKYREFSTIKGLRLQVSTMNTPSSRLDLIELSPRLSADLSYMTTAYSVTKEAADLSSSSMPIGGLLASTGNLELFDYELAFSEQNKKSILNVVDSNDDIVYNISTKNLQTKFYEILEVDDTNYYIPIKTLYSEGFPEVDAYERVVSIELRDLFSNFESKTPQEMLVVDQPVSYIVATLLDNVGFSNYKFYRLPGETDEVIPYFFVSKDSNVAEVLSQLAQATQSAMFFDEYNDLIIASKGYMFPESGQRQTDFSFIGTADSSKNGAYRNERTSNILANIQNIAAQDEPIYNDGKVTYSEKYIQKTIKNIAQASKLDKDRNWVYKPVMLWEISEKDVVKSINNERDNPGGYALTAIPLKNNLSSYPPEVVTKNGVAQVINNVISFGDSVYFVGRYNGYFYANGEVIKYDAVEYAVPTKAYTGFECTATQDSNTITLTDGDVSTLSVGDRVYRVSGSGRFGTGVSIVSIDVGTSSTTILLDGPSKATGSIVFTTTSTPTVWITSVDEYESYFAKIPFNGKMYPTGRVRIFAEANYDADDNLVLGPCTKHGRGQFGTPIVSHSAGLSKSWTASSSIGGCYMSMETLINGARLDLAPAGKITSATTTAPFTAKITEMRNRVGFYVGQKIFATKSTTLSETGTVGAVSGTGPYSANLTNLISSKPFYVGQEIEATAITDKGSFGTGTVTVTDIYSSTSVKIKSTATMTAGDVENVRVPDGNSGDLDDGIVEVTKIENQAVSAGQDPRYTVFVKSTSAMSNGDISAIYAEELPNGGYQKVGKTAEGNNYAASAKFSGLIKNYLANNNLSESVDVDPIQSSTMVQSSALVINGPSFKSENNPVDYISYTTKQLSDKYKYFGTRMRIIGQSGTDDSRLQTAVGSAGLTTIDGKLIAGSSGGISVLMNPKKNVGYYFEIVALTDNTVTNYTGDTEPISNVFFYKLRARYDYFVTEKPLDYVISNGVMGPAVGHTTDRLNIVDGKEQVGQVILFDTGDDELDGTWRIDSISSPWKLTKIPNIAYPEKLWSGMTSIQVDSGQLFGAGRVTGEPVSTVYDLGVEYKDIGSTRRFYLYINNLCVGYVDDTSPTEVYDHIALFSRGSARVMFENVYALTNSYSENTAAALDAPIAELFSDDGNMTQSDAFKKYALSGAVQSTYLSGIGSQEPPKYNMYYDEFGTIMRECAYFNIKYDQAYPALRSMLAPTFTTEKGYTVSGFYSNPYGAEFMLFNNTDTILALDESGGNYLRILGVAFTQDSDNDVTVDEYFSERGSLSNSEAVSSDNLSKNKKIFQDIKNSRSIYGKKEFSFESPFIQSREAAEKILGWTISKIGKPRKAIGLSIYPNPLLQLGDIVTVDYFDRDGIDVLGTDGKQFVVYSIEYQKESSGPSMTVHLSEVG